MTSRDFDVPEATKRIRSALTFWRAVDLGSRAGEIKTVLDGFEKENEVAKERRRTIHSAVLELQRGGGGEKAMNDVVQLFKGEVDALTKRARNAERSFRDFVSDLGLGGEDASVRSDPTVGLKEGLACASRCAGLLKQVSELEDRLSSEQRVVSEREDQASEVTVLRKRLEAEVRAREEAVRRGIEEREMELRTVFDEELQSLRTEEREAEARARGAAAAADAAERAVAEARAEVAEVRAEASRNEASYSDRMDMLNAEVERLQTLLAQHEYSGKGAVEAEERGERQRGVLLKEMMEEKRKLAEELERWKEKYSELETRGFGIEQEKQKIVDQHQTTLASLHFQTQTNESLTQQLDHLQSQFRKLQQDEQQLRAVLGDTSSSSVEDITTFRLRSVEEEAAALRLRVENLEAELDDSESHRQELELSLEHAKSQLQQWESRLESSPSAEPSTPAETTSPSPSSSHPEPQMDSILRTQRDWLKQRVRALEVDVDSRQTRIEHLSAKVRKLEADNSALADRVRYVESVQSGRHATDDVESAGELAVKRYENSHNSQNIPNSSSGPVQTFRTRNQLRRERSLAAPERAVLMCTRAASSSSIARWIVVVYFLLVHFIAFFTLWAVTHGPVCDSHISTENNNLPVPHLRDQYEK